MAHGLELDFDAIVEYETEHPEWSLMVAVGKAAETSRISDYNLLVGFLRKNGERMAPDYPAFLKGGCTAKDIFDAYHDGLTMLGFISEEDQSAE